MSQNKIILCKSCGKEIASDALAMYIKGIVKNNSGKDCTYVQITFTLYDKDGNQIGTALDNINNLEKDGTWKFKAMALAEEGEIANYKLTEITGF
ncbi:MAG: FxLYD domain-containing protein [Ruthenibacterium sp.]